MGSAGPGPQDLGGCTRYPATSAARLRAGGARGRRRPASRDLTFVVVGGGPTGVEMAATIAELRRYTLARDFRHIDPREATVMLLEGGPRILPSYPEELSAVAKSKLRGLGVEVRENMLVNKIERGYIEAAGWTIPTHTVVWAAGMRGSPLLKTLDTPLDRMGRAARRTRLQHPGPSRGIRHRRCGAFRGSGARIASWRGADRDPDGQVCRPCHRR